MEAGLNPSDGCTSSGDQDVEKERKKQELQRLQKAISRMKNPATIIVVRHGETEWNLQGRLQGQQEPGPPLTPRGFSQAQRTAAFINGEPAATHVYSSDLMRCRQSAEAIATATGFPVTHDPRLRERALGQLEGMTRAEARASLPEVYLAAMSGAPNRAPPGTGVESLEEMRKRVASVLWDIARRHAGHRVVVVSHGGTLGQLRALSANSPKPGAVANCSVGTVLADAETRTACIMSWGNTEHLGEDSVGLTEGGGGRGG